MLRSIFSVNIAYFELDDFRILSTEIKAAQPKHPLSHNNDDKT
jgi:hypothetical protein